MFESSNTADHLNCMTLRLSSFKLDIREQYAIVRIYPTHGVTLIHVKASHTGKSQISNNQNLYPHMNPLTGKIGSLIYQASSFTICSPANCRFTEISATTS